MSDPHPSSATDRTYLRRMVDGALDGLYPRICRGCEVFLAPETPRSGVDAWLCSPCRENLTRVEAPYCNVCGEPFDGPMTEAFRCWNCQGRRIAFDFAVSRFRAEGPVREMIHAFKYNRDLSLRGALSDLLRESLDDPRLKAADLSTWLLVPVPLHPMRALWRGFNQSWELCRQLSSLTGIPAAQVLLRRQWTHTQARLNRHKRLANLRGAFALRHSFPGRRLPMLKGRCILLVDDVLTTGATAHECAKVLKLNAEAEKVVVITAARG